MAMLVSDERGVADFEQLHSREHDSGGRSMRALGDGDQSFRLKTTTGFGRCLDPLELNGEDLRQLMLDERKSKLAKLLKGSRHHGIVLNEHLETHGERAFYHPCGLGFEGIVSKRRDSRYVSGRSKIKVKNPNTPGVLRFRDQDL
jgi:bifunctional non-homologous end joining protein LigD